MAEGYRRIISECISHWFGSIQSFQNYVQSEMRPALVHELGKHAFSYRLFLQMCSPVCWHYMDRSAGNRRWEQLGAVLTWGVSVVPMLCVLAVRLAHLLRTRYWWPLDIPISVAVVISAALPLLVVSLAHEHFLSWCKDVRWDAPRASFGVVSFCAMVLISRCAPAIRD